MIARTVIAPCALLCIACSEKAQPPACTETIACISAGEAPRVPLRLAPNPGSLVTVAETTRMSDARGATDTTMYSMTRRHAPDDQPDNGVV